MKIKSHISLILPYSFTICIILLLLPINGYCLATNTMSSTLDVPTSESPLHITLDYKKTNGIIKAYSEIQEGPIPNPLIRNHVDLTKQFQQIGISYIEPHNLATGISTMFPDWDADPTLESSYDFTVCDKYVTSIINAGCRVLFTLHENALIDISLRTLPKNMSKWAEVCKHIVMHYNDGWNNGYYYNITYWEFLSEPDKILLETPENYYQLYNITARTLKAYNSSLKIGGPCTFTVTFTNKRYTEDFLNYIVENNLPFDFFSWHHFPYTPNQLYSESQAVLFLLNKYGLTDCENILTSWNPWISRFQRDHENAKNAAFTACSLTTFQDAGIDYAFRFRGSPEREPHRLFRFLGLDASLFSRKGMFKKPALAYLAMRYVTRDTPIRLTTPIMDVSYGITYLAGNSEDDTNVSILISNYNFEDTKYNLELTNLPWNTSYTAVHYLIDDKHHLEVVEKNTLSESSYIISKTLKSNTVQLIRLTNSSHIPDEGPPTARIPIILRLKILDPLSRALNRLIFFIMFSNNPYANVLHKIIMRFYDRLIN